MAKLDFIRVYAMYRKMTFGVPEKKAFSPKGVPHHGGGYPLTKLDSIRVYAMYRKWHFAYREKAVSPMGGTPFMGGPPPPFAQVGSLLCLFSGRSLK